MKQSYLVKFELKIVDIAPRTNLAVCWLEDINVPREKCRAGNSTLKWKDIEEDVQWRSQGDP